MNLMSVSITIYLIFVKMIAQIVLISMNFNDLIRYAKIKTTEMDKKFQNLCYKLVFVYQRLMDFPQGKFDYETQITIIFFESIYKIINIKIHLHHSHVTGKI